MANRIQVRRDTAANWTTANPVLAAGEPALETDTGRRKTGDGTTVWTALPYVFDKTIADATYTTPAAADAAYAPITGSVNYLAPGQLDAANAANINTPTTATAGALNATYGPESPALKAAIDTRNSRVVLAGSGIDPTGVADSTAALQAKIDAAPDGTELFLPTGRYKLTDALKLRKRFTLRGAGMFTTHLGRNAGGSLDLPAPPDYFHGAVLVQTAPAKNILELTKAATMVNLHNFGMLFSGASVMNVNTGHGVWSEADTFMTGTIDEHECGNTRFDWSNVGVYGNDGNHYGFWLTNPLHGVLTNVVVFGGGGFRIKSDSKISDPNYGNLVLTQCFVEEWNAGTAHGFAISCERTRSMNLVTMVRPQVNLIGAAAANTAQMMYTQTIGAGVVNEVDIVSPDFECWENANTVVDFGDMTSGAVVYPGLVNAKAVQPYRRIASGKYLRLTATGTFNVPFDMTRVRVRVTGGGGGGAGGGAANTAVAQVGGGGGGAGAVTESVLDLTPGAAIAITVGAAGTGGTGGPAGGGPGSGATSGGETKFGTYMSVSGGSSGSSPAANVTTPVNGGVMGGFTRVSVNGIPGAGGPSGMAATPAMYASGGSGGGASTTTNGGGGGAAAGSVAGIGQERAAGAAGTSGTADGLNGGSSPVTGCGGGGGGGGAQTGKGGNGGNGGPGSIELWW